MKFPLCCYTANSTHKMNENKSTIQKLLSGSTKKVLTLLTKVREKYQLFLQDTFSPSLLDCTGPSPFHVSPQGLSTYSQMSSMPFKTYFQHGR